MKLGELIKEYRRNNDMTMQEFADRAGLSKGYISMLEKNKHPQSQRELVPSFETYEKVASAMCMTLDDVVSVLDGNENIRLNSEEFEESVSTTVAKNLSHILRSKNMTQLELSELMGVSTATVSNWCNGIKLPRMDKIDKLCTILSINRSDLVDNKPSSSPAPLQLSSREERLVVTFRDLNDEGQDKVLEYEEDLVSSGKYIKSCEHEVVV